MENDAECPAAHLCHHFTKGNISNFDDVYNFGKGLDALTIEIEAVNEDALEKLEREGVRIYPKPAALRIIKNKILTGIQRVETPGPYLYQAIGNIKRNKITISILVNIADQSKFSHSFYR